MKRFFLKLAGFLAATGGNVATIFSLALVPIAVMGGGAVDFAQAMNARGRLAEALDAAALAVGSNPNLTLAQSEQAAMDFLAANYPASEIGDVHSISLSIDEESNTVLISGQSRVPTSLLGIIGMDFINVDWTSEVVRASFNLELVMVLDNTGSMGGSRIRALRDAAQLLTRILHENAQEPDDLMIGLVPFTATVNVGQEYERAWWMDAQAENPLHSERFDTPTNRWDLYDSLRNTSWNGCVEARAIPHDIEDTPPSRNDPETLFLPYFAPDEPDRGGRFRNNYLNDGLSGNWWRRLENVAKYWGQRPRGSGPNWGCTADPVTPMTTSRATIDNAIRAMDANGTTNIPIGISWGVRLISPQEPFTEGTPYGDRETIKAMVILTDGDNYLNGVGNPLQSDYSGYGYMRDGRLGINSASDNRIRRELDARTAAACQYAREQGIRVYTITFQVRSSSTRRMMEACASHPSLYFDSPSASALETTFEIIAGDLANLRISR